MDKASFLNGPPTGGMGVDMPEDRRRRHDMVRQQILARGIRNPRVIRAMARVPRHFFTRLEASAAAYSDYALASDYGQTISQPFMVAIMTAELDTLPQQRILEIGTGTGYQTAVLARMGAEVFTIEYVPELSKAAENRLRQLGYTNIHYRIGDGAIGWKSFAPFTGILVTAGAPAVPQPLLEQLSDGGNLVIPIGDSSMQVLKRCQRHGNAITETDILDCRFVPLRGQYGWR
ncbi:MAG: protein-L-isoaspartate(D-aspartate) O-methyltransferase [Phycisphaerae bacterium]